MLFLSLFLFLFDFFHLNFDFVFVSLVCNIFLFISKKVWCGTTTGETLRIHIRNRQVNTMMRNHTHVVSGIHLVVHDIENPIMYTTSMDATIVVKKIEIKR